MLVKFWRVEKQGLYINEILLVVELGYRAHQILWFSSRLVYINKFKKKISQLRKIWPN